MRTVPCALIAALLAAVPVSAQQIPARVDSVRADSTIVLEPLTVRAVRAPRSAFAVPLAVTRVSPAERAGGRGVGLDEALILVPGVVAQSRAGGTDIRLSIRGYGARGAGDRSNAGTARGVRVLLDGIPETEPDGRTAFDQVDLATLAGIEVIRSNASALWGNAAGGVVSLSTLDPDAPGGLQAEASGGSYGLRRVSLRTGAALGDGALAAALTTTQMDGWRAHSDGSRTLASLSLLTTVGRATRLGVFAVASDNAYRIPGPLTLAQVDSNPAQANATYAARDERRHNRLGRLGVTLEHELGGDASVGGMLFLSPKYLQRSERGTFRDFTRYHVGGNLVARRGVRFGRTVTGTLLAGVDEAYQDGAILFYSLTPQGTRGDTLRDDKREGANNFGVFVQQELQFGERLGVVVGARYDAIAYTAQNFLDPSIDDARTFSRLTPKLGVTWQFTPRHSVYASVGGGVEAPAGNETDPAGTFGQDTVYGINPLLAPIRSTTFEVGTKRLLALPHLSLAYDVALYRTVVHNEIVPYRGGRFYFTAGEAHRSGVEVGATLRARQAYLATALTLSRHRYAEYVVDSVHYGRPGATADYAGHRVVGVPDAAYTVSGGYTLPGRLPLLARLTLQGMSRWFADDANAVVVPAFRTLSAGVGFEEAVPVGGGVGLRGFVTVNNLTNRRYVASAFLNPDVVGGVPVAFEPGLPRHVVVSFSVARVARGR